MKQYITFTNILLVVLIAVVLWLLGAVADLHPSGTVYTQNQDNGYVPIRTHFGLFPTLIEKIASKDDGAELSLAIVNPTTIHFEDAKIFVHIRDVVEMKKINLVPGGNKAKLKIPSIERGDPIQISLELNEVNF